MKRRVLTKTTSFHPLFIKKKEAQHGVILNGTVLLLLPLDVQRGKKSLCFCFFSRSLSLSLFPQLDQTLTRHTPSTHPAITLKKGEGSHALQKTPHATLPCAMTRQDKVASSPSTYKYGEAEKKGGGRKKRGKEKRKKKKRKRDRGRK